MIAYQCLDQWLKEHPHADQAHKVVRYDRDRLISYCGSVFPAAEAAKSPLGVRLCPACVELSRRRDHSQLQALMNHFDARRVYAAGRK